MTFGDVMEVDAFCDSTAHREKMLDYWRYVQPRHVTKLIQKSLTDGTGHVMPANASGALMISFSIAKLNGVAHNDYICKLSCKRHDGGWTLHETERSVYGALKKHFSEIPFAVLMPIAFDCNFTYIFPDLNDRTSRAAYIWHSQMLQTGHFHPSEVTVILLERGRGKPMFDFPLVDLELDDLLNLIAQAAYAFAALEQLGIWHNDVHMGNVLVEDLGTGCIERLKLSMGDGPIIEMHTRWLVKIFDFDQAQFSRPLEDARAADGALQRHFGANPCRYIGICRQEGRDIAQFMYNLSKLQLPPRGLELLQILHPIVSDPAPLVSPGHPCRRIAPGQECRPMIIPTSKQVFESVASVISRRQLAARLSVHGQVRA